MTQSGHRKLYPLPGVVDPFRIKSVLETNARIVAGAFSALRGSFGHWT
jgi:hypothetical protein